LAPGLHYPAGVNPGGGAAVDLSVWIPLTLGLGAGSMVLVYLFAEACDRV
jgi:hypothetical protein